MTLRPEPFRRPIPAKAVDARTATPDLGVPPQDACDMAVYLHTIG